MTGEITRATMVDLQRLVVQALERGYVVFNAEVAAKIGHPPCHQIVIAEPYALLRGTYAEVRDLISPPAPPASAARRPRAGRAGGEKGAAA